MKFDASRLFSRSKRSLTTKRRSRQHEYITASSSSSPIGDEDDLTIGETISAYSEHESSSTTGQFGSSNISHRVCFDEGENIYHDNPLEDKEEWKSILWYSKEECAAFKRSNKIHAKRIRSTLAKLEEHESWVDSLLRIYYAFHHQQQHTNSIQDIQRRLDETNIYLDEDSVGVEHMIMPSVTKDIIDRRENILDEISMIQNDSTLSDNQKQLDIANLMQTKCCASRLYALYLCHVRTDPPTNNQ